MIAIVLYAFLLFGASAAFCWSRVVAERIRQPLSFLVVWLGLSAAFYAASFLYDRTTHALPTEIITLALNLMAVGCGLLVGRRIRAGR